MESSYLELLDKENDLSFDLSFLDSIALNEESKLDSVEATITFLTDGIQKFQMKLNILRPQKRKASRRANVLLHHSLQNRLSLFQPNLCPKKHRILPSGQFVFSQIGAMKEMGVRRLYLIAQWICLNMSKSPMAIQNANIAIPCRHWTFG